MMKKAQELNITYHPILENFNEFNDVPRAKFNESLKFPFVQSIIAGDLRSSMFRLSMKKLCIGYTICRKPCVTVEYKMTLDKFSLTTDETSAYAGGGPNRGVCWIQLSRTVQFEVVRERKKISNIL